MPWPSRSRLFVHRGSEAGHRLGVYPVVSSRARDLTASVWLCIAEIFTRFEHFEDAERALAEVASLNPKCAELSFQRGYLYEHRGTVIHTLLALTAVCCTRVVSSASPHLLAL